MRNGKRKLYLNCDDLGFHPTIDDAVLELLELDIPISASLATVGPSWRSAARRLRAIGATSVGVHLAVTAEYESLPMRPLSLRADVPSLVQANGCFFRGVSELAPRISMKELALELERQVEAVADAGLGVSHVDGHVFFYEDDELGEQAGALVESLANRWGVPCRRLAPRPDSRQPAVIMIWEGYESLESRWRFYEELPRTCREELGELILHPGKDLDQLGSFTKSGIRRYADYLFFLDSSRRAMFSSEFELATRAVGM